MVMKGKEGPLVLTWLGSCEAVCVNIPVAWFIYTLSFFFFFLVIYLFINYQNLINNHNTYIGKWLKKKKKKNDSCFRETMRLLLEYTIPQLEQNYTAPHN